MASITTRTGKGTPLTNTELDANFTNLNTNKLELGGAYTASVANAIPFFNASKVLGSSAALTFDGSNFGVGTSSPEAKLHISGGQVTVAHFGEGANGAGIAVHNRLAALPTTGTAVNIAWLESTSGYTAGSLLLGARPGVGQVVLSATGAADVVIQPSSGSLGIGTSSPAYKLHVSGSGDVYGQIGSTNSGAYLNLDASILAPDYKAIWGTVSGVRKWGIGNYGTTARDVIAFYTGGVTERMRLDAYGNLGLGVTPGAWGNATTIQLAGQGSAINGALYQGAIGGNNAGGITYNALYNGTTWQYIYSASHAAIVSGI